MGHGASSLTSPLAFEQLGAQVTVINDDFDGCDINVECGSTCLDPLRKLMKDSGADVGIAHDGDADNTTEDHIQMIPPCDGGDDDIGKHEN